MSSRVTCLLVALAVTLVSAQDPTKAIKIKAIKPGDAGSTGDTLQVLCTFDISKTDNENVVSIELLASPLGGYQNYPSVVLANTSGVFIAQGEDVTATANLDTSVEKANLDVNWLNKDDGYCRSYMCKVQGIDLDRTGTLQSVSRTVKVKSSDGVACNKKQQDQSSTPDKEENPNQCCGSSEEVQNNTKAIEGLEEKIAPIPQIISSIQQLSQAFQMYAQQIQQFSRVFEAVQGNMQWLSSLSQQVANLTSRVDDEAQSNAQQFREIQRDLSSGTRVHDQEALKKVLSIDRSKYAVSSLYKTQIYIATKRNELFDFQKANDECKTNGGYLVEFDGEEEQNFVKDFMKTTDTSVYYTGGNDVDNEGKFVYYNSGKPVVDVVWNNGEPNDGGGHEDCMEIQLSGMNDITCGRNVKFICEIPLF